jgi:hypothetical protein
MDKILPKIKDFLEKYVQFVALGVAALVLIWAAWTFAFDPNIATAPLGNDRVGPGSVDQRLRSTVVEDLRARAKDGRVIDFAEPEISIDRDEIRMAVASDLQLQSALFPRSDVPLFEASDSTGTEGGVVALPVLPPAQVATAASGKAFVQVPDEVAAGEPEQDVIYVVVPWEIDVAALRDMFRRAVLPERVSSTNVLAVTLVRERLLEDGSFGERQEVERLRQYPLPAIPATDAASEEKLAFLEQTRQAASIVVQPPFYAVLAGESPLDLSLEGGDPLSPEPPEDMGGGRRDPGFGGRGGPNPGGRGGPGGRGVPGPPPGVPPPGQDGEPYDPDRFDEGREPPEDDPFVEPDPTQGDPLLAGGEVPSEFDPTRLTNNIRGWAYDENAKPGETYRYNVIYSLRNPVFNTVNVTADEALSQQFALTVDRDMQWEEQWSDPVEVAPINRFFMRSLKPGNVGARFSVFRWQRGAWREDNFEVFPGDPLGGEREGIDYATGRVLVDIRPDPATRTQLAILTDAEGRFSRHDDDEDRSKEYERLQQLVESGETVASGR